MNKFLRAFFMLAQVFYVHAEEGVSLGQPKDELRGCIKIQGANDTVPTFRIIFNGKETSSNKEGFYTIPLDSHKAQKYSFVVCKRIQHHVDKMNTLKEISIIPEKQYRYFSCRQSPYTGAWQHKEKTLHKKNFIVPDNCVVVLVDPKYIERIEPWELEFASNIFKLPSIILKKGVGFEKLDKEAVKSLLYSVDHTIFHEPVREIAQESQKNQRVSVSLVR